jgi:hypothetical protein
MMLLVLAHVVRLRNGTYAARSSEFPRCRGEDADASVALSQLEAAIVQQIAAILEEGDTPRFFSYEEIEVEMLKSCKHDVYEPDRAPGAGDVVLIRRMKLASELMERLEARRSKPDKRSAVAVTAEKLVHGKEAAPSKTFRTELEQLVDPPPKDLN